MKVVGAISICFGLIFLAVAREAFECDEPRAAALAGLCGSVFVLVGMKALTA